MSEAESSHARPVCLTRWIVILLTLCAQGVFGKFLDTYISTIQELDPAKPIGADVAPPKINSGLARICRERCDLGSCDRTNWDVADIDEMVIITRPSLLLLDPDERHHEEGRLMHTESIRTRQRSRSV